MYSQRRIQAGRASIVATSLVRSKASSSSFARTFAHPKVWPCLTGIPRPKVPACIAGSLGSHSELFGSTSSHKNATGINECEPMRRCARKQSMATTLGMPNIASRPRDHAWASHPHGRVQQHLALPDCEMFMRVCSRLADPYFLVGTCCLFSSSTSCYTCSVSQFAPAIECISCVNQHVQWLHDQTENHEFPQWLALPPRARNVAADRAVSGAAVGLLPLRDVRVRVADTLAVPSVHQREGQEPQHSEGLQKRQHDVTAAVHRPNLRTEHTRNCPKHSPSAKFHSGR